MEEAMGSQVRSQSQSQLQPQHQRQQDEQDQHRAKRKRTNHAGNPAPIRTRASRRRSTGKLQTGPGQLLVPEAKANSWQVSQSGIAVAETPPEQAGVLVTTPVHDTGLASSQAYHESRLHHTGSELAKIDYVLSIQQRRAAAAAAVGSSRQNPDVLPIACDEPTRDNVDFTPAAPSPSLESGPAAQLYNPSFHHPHPKWPNSRHPGDQGNHQFQTSSSPQPRPVPLFTPSGTDYPYSFGLQPQVHGLGDATGHVNAALPSTTNIAPHGQDTHAIPAHLFGPDPSPGDGGGNSLFQHDQQLAQQQPLFPVHHHHHHHQQQQQHGLSSFDTGPTDFPAAAPVHGMLPSGADPQFAVPQFAQQQQPQLHPHPDSDINHQPQPGFHTLSPGSYYHPQMGGGDYMPLGQEHHQSGETQPSHVQSHSFIAPHYNSTPDMMNSEAAGLHMFEQPGGPGNSVVQPQPQPHMSFPHASQDPRVAPEAREMHLASRHHPMLQAPLHPEVPLHPEGSSTPGPFHLQPLHHAAAAAAANGLGNNVSIGGSLTSRSMSLVSLNGNAPTAVDEPSDDSEEVDFETIAPRRATEPDPLPIRTEGLPTGSARRRSAFDADQRKKTAETRKRKACVRCRIQKTRCAVDDDEPDGACKPCRTFSKTSKKTIHFTPCYRGKLTDAVLYRSGGLELTRRWSGTEMKDIGGRYGGEARTIHISLGLCDKPLVVTVVRFKAQDGDVTARFWTVREGGDEVRKKKDLEPYCLDNIHKTATYFEKYVIENAVPAMLKQRLGPVKLAGRDPSTLGVIERTYLAAILRYKELEEESAGLADAESNREKRLLGNLFILWFATRHTTGMSYICGEEKLGMKPETRDETYPLYGKVSVPRMILAQVDSINHSRLLSKYGKLVLQDLEELLIKNQGRWWFTIYLCLFILLREASWMSEDRYRHARNNFGKKIRYSIPQFVENLQEGCNNLLMHWHYYNCKPWPDPATPWDRHKSFLADLSSEQYDLVMETMTDLRVQKQLKVWRRFKEENGYVEKPKRAPSEEHESNYIGAQTQYDWDHPFYWVSQLFEEKWHPHPTYQRESV